MPYIGKKPADIIATVIDTTTGTFSGEVDAGSLDVSGNADIDGITNLDNTDIDGTLDVSGNLTVDTNTLFVDATNNSVGIGTTDIVNYSGYNSLRLGSAGNVQAYNSTSNGNIFIAEGAAINSAGNWEYLRSDFATYYRQGDGTHTWASAPSGIDGNTVSFSERMRIDSGGNIGIGTTNPSRKLSIYDATNPYMALYDGSSGTTISDGFQVQFASSNAYLWNYENGFTAFGTNANERMRISSAGNVGIGNLGNAATLLHIGSTGTPEFRIQDLDAGGGYLTITHGAGVSTISADPTNSSGSPKLIFKTNNTERMRIDANGNIGIGTSSPDQLLHISGGSGTTRMMFTRSNTAATGNSFGELNFENSVGTKVANIIAFSGSGNTEAAIKFGVGLNATEAVRIDNNGNLLVGTTDSNLTDNTTGSGVVAQANGALVAARQANTPFYINRTGTSNGTLVDFRKDGGTVGSIGVNSVYTYIGTPSVNTLIKFDNSAIHPVNSSGNTRDNAIDLGNAAARFKNLYLSGTAKIEKAGQVLNLDTPSASQNVWMNFSDNGSVKWEIQKNTSNVLNIYSYDASSTVMSFDGTGAITKPLQPAFLAHPTSTIVNINTGANNGLVFGTERFDNNSDYNASTGVFTAPVTGKYMLNASFYLLNIDSAAGYYEPRLDTSNKSYYIIVDPDFGQDNTYFTITFAQLVDMDAGDTAVLNIHQDGGTSQTDISAGSMFSMYLVC